MRARYLAGCDGMNSTVRTTEGIEFAGARYPQTFLLADLEVDGLEAGTVNAFLTAAGPLLFFPLDRPAPWRVIAMRADSEGGDDQDAVLSELQYLTEIASNGRLRLHEPVWTLPSESSTGPRDSTGVDAPSWLATRLTSIVPSVLKA